jgi:hypothetical protein
MKQVSIIHHLRLFLRNLMRFESTYTEMEPPLATQFDRVVHIRTRYVEHVRNAIRLKGTILPKILPVLALVVGEAVLVCFLNLVLGLPLYMDDK